MTLHSLWLSSYSGRLSSLAHSASCCVGFGSSFGEGSNFPVISSCPQKVNVNVQMSLWNLSSKEKVTGISPPPAEQGWGALHGGHEATALPLSGAKTCWNIPPVVADVPLKKDTAYKDPKVTERQVIPKLAFLY